MFLRVETRFEMLRAGGIPLCLEPLPIPFAVTDGCDASKKKPILYRDGSDNAREQALGACAKGLA
jgi:hypothetical protein